MEDFKNVEILAGADMCRQQFAEFEYLRRRLLHRNAIVGIDT